LALLLALILASASGAGRGAISATAAIAPNERVAYALTIDIPAYQGKTLGEFGTLLCTPPNHGKDDASYLATIDLDPDSSSYSQVIHRSPTPQIGAEIHHMHINEDRTRVVMYDLYASRAEIYDIQTDPRAPRHIRQVNLGEASRRLLGPVPGLGISVGYGAPHESLRLDNGNWLVVMNSVYVPERPDLHEGAPGGFIELTPDGDVVDAFPDLRFVDGKLENGLYEGNGLFSVDYNKRLRMMVHADLMTHRTYKNGVGLGPVEFGNEVVLWNFDMKSPERSSVFQRLHLPTAVLTSPHAVQRRIKGMDVFYVSSLFSGVWAVYRKPPDTEFHFKHVYPLPIEAGHGSSHIRIAPNDETIYVTDALGDTIHVLRIADDPLNPVLLQKVPAQHIHVVKFSKDGRRLYGSNGIASIIDFQFRTPSFGVDYGIRAWDVLTNGTLAPNSSFVDALDEPGAPPLSNGVFFGDLVLRENPTIVH
jgi:selenium-binding protein 1